MENFDWDMALRWAVAVVVPIVLAYIGIKKEISKEETKDNHDDSTSADVVKKYAETVKTMSEAYGNIQDKLSKFVDEVSGLREKIIELQDLVNDITSDRDAIRKENTLLRAQVAVLTDTIDNLNTKVMNLHHGIDVLISQLKRADIVPDFQIDVEDDENKFSNKGEYNE